MKRILGSALAALALLASPAFAQYAFRVEPNHSSVSFVVPIAGGITKVRGSFTKFTIDLVHDERDLAKWSVNATINVASINTGISDRDQHLQAAEFFDAANHPQITFRSSRIEKRGEKYVARGELTIRDVTKPVALEFVITGYHHDKSEPDRGPVMGIALHTVVNRIEFKVGTDWKHTIIPNFLGNEITVEIDFWTRQGKRVATAATPES